MRSLFFVAVLLMLSCIAIAPAMAEPTWLTVEEWENSATEQPSYWSICDTWENELTVLPKVWTVVETWQDTVTGHTKAWTTVETWYNEIEAEASPNYSGGTGTSSDPYQITTWEQLAYCHNCSGSYFILMNDLDENSTGYDDYAGPSANTNTGWLPLGRSNYTYYIYLDGNDHVISDLYIDRSANEQGFIAYNMGGYIKNLGIDNATVKGNDSIAVLCVTASNCDIENVFVKNSLLHGYGDTNAFIGGMFWRIQNTVSATHYIKNCYCDIEITYNNTLTGYVKIGGFCYDTVLTQSGYSITDCYAVTDISTTPGTETLTTSGFNHYQNGLASVSDCFWDSTIGPATSAEGIGKTTIQMQDLDTFDDWDISDVEYGNDPTHVWNIIDDESYPFLSIEMYGVDEWHTIETWNNEIEYSTTGYMSVETWLCSFEIEGDDTGTEPLVPMNKLISKILLPLILLFTPAFALAGRFGIAGFIMGAILGMFLLWVGVGMSLGLVLLGVFVLVGIWARMD